MLTQEQIILIIQSLKELQDIYTDEYSCDLYPDQLELLEHLKTLLKN